MSESHEYTTRRSCTYVEIQDRHIDVVEQLAVILDRITAGEEHDNFLLHIFLEETEQKQESPIRVTNDISL